MPPISFHEISNHPSSRSKSLGSRIELSGFSMLSVFPPIV
jgi:hypothetical protein